MVFRSVFFSFLICVAATTGVAQDASDEQAVEEVFRRLFKGMELGDSAMVHSVFVTKPTMATLVKDKSGKTLMRQDSGIEPFLKAVGTPHKEVWYEEIWNLQITVDGDLAQGWCDYAFYVDKNFSHCGVDAFQMARLNGEWKIFHLADTRRKENCTIPKAIQDKHK